MSVAYKDILNLLYIMFYPSNLYILKTCQIVQQCHESFSRIQNCMYIRKMTVLYERKNLGSLCTPICYAVNHRFPLFFQNSINLSIVAI